MKRDEILAILDEASFLSDQVQVLSLRPERMRIDFPFTMGPVNFSVFSEKGLPDRLGEEGRTARRFLHLQPRH